MLKHIKDGGDQARNTDDGDGHAMNFFKLYKKLGGMTGTAKTEENEFWKIYKLDVVCVPTNKPLRRIEHRDPCTAPKSEKWDAVVNEVEETYASGRPAS
ncbi:MAG: hypothetical protein U0792_13680 [Gemmataceae bacterium]